MSLPTCFRRDETLSEQDLLQKLQVVKGDVRCGKVLDCFGDEDVALGEDATLDEIWNAYSGVAIDEPVDLGHHIVESRIAPFNGCIDPDNQPPLLLLDTVGPRELMGCDYRPAAVRSGSFHAHATLGEQG